MTGNDYIETVLAQLRHVTGDERESIRRELDAHLEDHTEALRQLGYDEETAQEQAAASMGDPVEMGRELSRQYTGWPFVLLSRAAVLLTVILCSQALFGVATVGYFLDSLLVRTFPDDPGSDYAVEATIRPDIRISIGDDVLRVVRVSLIEREGVPTAELFLCAYDRLPGGVVSQQLIPNVVLADQRGAAPEHVLGGGGRGSYTADFSTRYVPIREGDTYITLRYDRFGETVEAAIPLPEGGEAGA